MLWFERDPTATSMIGSDVCFTMDQSMQKDSAIYYFTKTFVSKSLLKYKITWDFNQSESLNCQKNK